jgi:hypothetical protein
VKKFLYFWINKITIKMKKVLFALVALAMVTMVSCRGHRTCPTYLKNTAENTEFSVSVK